MNSLFGIKIITDPSIQPVPRMQVSHEFARLQSPELVASTNAWMRDFFGTHLPTYVLDAGALGLRNGKVIVMHPDKVNELRMEHAA